MQIVLASTSPYRKELLARLRLPFETARPEVDETPHDNESPMETARRLALAKAQAVVARFPGALIIGSDQVAAMGGHRFGKPGSIERAVAQLQHMSGRTVVFHTAVALIHAPSGRQHCRIVPTEVRFRELGDDEIRRYVDTERPLDCAGSAKSEGLGITLLSALASDDPTALIGLPLVALSAMLRSEGLSLP